MLQIQSKPIRTVLGWQGLATAAITPLVGLLAGPHAAISAGLGGLVGLVGGLAFGFVVSLHKKRSAGGVLLTAMRAEAVKVALIVFLMWLVLANYQNVVVVAFIGTFTVSIIIFSMAIFVRDA